ncbi:MAG TPA: HAMP domain-containing sensor histidine kinase [Anaerolineales bacterium]
MNETILLILPDPENAQRFAADALCPAGYPVTIINDVGTADLLLQGQLPDLVILSEPDLEWAGTLPGRFPYLPVLLLLDQPSESLEKRAWQLGLAGSVPLSARAEEALQKVGQALERGGWHREWARREIQRGTKPLQKRLNASELERKRLETILACVEESVIVLDGEQRFVLANRTARLAFDLGEQNLAGKRAVELIRNEDLLGILAGERLLKPFQAEIALEGGRVLNAQFTPIPEIGLALTMQEITRLKRLDQAKTEFVSTVSHDLRSPLTAILGYVDLLDRVGTINEPQREFIQHVRNNVHNITALINDLLDLSRIEAGYDAHKEHLPFDALVRAALEVLQDRAAEKRQAVTLDLPPGLPQVLGNPVRLKQMLGNLIGNAIKYTPPEGEIGVSARVESGQVIFQVSDSGPGIPLSDQPHIFEKFYRGSNVPADTPGTGLGLAIVKSIVADHQGRTWVDSAPGAGAIFSVVLPAAH